MGTGEEVGRPRLATGKAGSSGDEGRLKEFAAFYVRPHFSGRPPRGQTESRPRVRWGLGCSLALRLGSFAIGRSYRKRGKNAGRMPALVGGGGDSEVAPLQPMQPAGPETSRR